MTDLRDQYCAWPSEHKAGLLPLAFLVKVCNSATVLRSVVFMKLPNPKSKASSDVKHKIEVLIWSRGKFDSRIVFWLTFYLVGVKKTNKNYVFEVYLIFTNDLTNGIKYTVHKWKNW